MSNHGLVSLIHLGCARNLIDSELILARMAEEGLTITGDADQAQTVVLNTCSFIGPARDESYQSLEALLERKRQGTLKSVVVAGCLVQRYKQKLREDYPEVDLFAEISDYRGLAKSVRELSEGRTIGDYLSSPGLRPAERDGSRLLSTPGSFAYLRISHGCDHVCSFCAIPSIRGPHRSKRPSAVLEEASELIAAGVGELVLVAEDSTAWGRDFGMELPDLVEALANLEGDHRIRIMYAYPGRFPWRLTELLRDHPRVLPYLDIPIQHGTSRMLKAMRRTSSVDQVHSTLARLREEVPGITLRTTMLVGFPGEQEEDVDGLIELIETYQLGRLGAFPFSIEEGTHGATLPDRVEPATIEARLERVLQARDRVLAQVQESKVGERITVWVDEPPDEEGWVVARGAWDAPEVDPFVNVFAPDAQVGQALHVIIREVDESLNLIAEEDDR
ncbi:MAG: 30S ribosomal protein S12 methylthiotransferase RimO [Planctomycetes bacterium]|nr:30S ribosomal protein S12 methylthiotransferase RimO [Planctomycetota bacterium]MCB9909632.1 30S ribosomal protein S12 methylthiotransferase RimO [Planctomycetota bacterium]MCB9911879.1 30S ribosomal protein S12 methylthiotransferase RimO [Planctomycetota bacterium]HPF12698.1 30S ribosomal protein S12 methylthiotransferase RimO [Planctomycetota bacterium]HRV80133.1 30S ribosomal protein S12 methylthiotransferase RimO [Planctomycetota bacterium]